MGTFRWGSLYWKAAMVLGESEPQEWRLLGLVMNALKTLITEIIFWHLKATLEGGSLQYIMEKIGTWFCHVVFGFVYYQTLGILVIDLPIHYRVASLVMKLSYGCINASDETLKDLGQPLPTHNKYAPMHKPYAQLPGSTSKWNGLLRGGCLIIWEFSGETVDIGQVPQFLENKRLGD